MVWAQNLYEKNKYLKNHKTKNSTFRGLKKHFKNHLFHPRFILSYRAWYQRATKAFNTTTTSCSWQVGAVNRCTLSLSSSSSSSSSRAAAAVASSVCRRISGVVVGPCVDGQYNQCASESDSAAITMATGDAITRRRTVLTAVDYCITATMPFSSAVDT